MKRLAVGLLALVILIGCAAVYAADTGTGESLVTQGYLNDTYIPDVLRQATREQWTTLIPRSGAPENR